MIYVIRVRGVYRGRRFKGWRARAAIFFLSAVLGSAFIGASLGALGAALSTSGRPAVILGVSLVGAALGGAEILGRRPWVLQRDQATNQRWMRFGATVNSAANGVAMGIGFATRIGYWLWYVLPIVAVLSGSWRTGALLFFAYASVRAGIGVFFAVTGETRRESAHRLQDYLARLNPLMRTICAGTLAVVSVAYAVAMGGPKL